jgi:arylformamidase
MQRVFLDYDQKALDDAYDQAVYAPNRDQVLLRRDRGSQLARERLGEPRRLAYGPGRNEQLDFFAARAPSAPILVFIHGGAWRAGRARDYSAPAEMLLDAGAHYAVLDFDNTGDCDGDLFVMADQVRRAVAWMHRNAVELGGDATRLHVAGGSSGAHLGGVVAATPWEKDFGLPPDIVKSFTLCSGMYDLRGPRLSKRSAYVRFTDAMEDALSPQRHLEHIRAPVTLLYGSLETPEFKRQAQEFAAALRAAGKAVRLIHAEGYNHFEIQETLANPYGAMGRAVLEQMRLAPAIPRAAPAARGAPSPT